MVWINKFLTIWKRLCPAQNVISARHNLANEFHWLFSERGVRWNHLKSRTIRLHHPSSEGLRGIFSILFIMAWYLYVSLYRSVILSWKIGETCSLWSYIKEYAAFSCICAGVFGYAVPVFYLIHLCFLKKTCLNSNHY